jgi:hypothetical protein
MWAFPLRSNHGMLASSQTLRPASHMKGTTRSGTAFRRWRRAAAATCEGVGRQGARRRCTEHLHHEGVPGRAHEQVSLAPDLDLYLLLGYVQEARQHRGDFRNEPFFRGSHGHVSTFGPDAATSLKHRGLPLK